MTLEELDRDQFTDEQWDELRRLVQERGWLVHEARRLVRLIGDARLIDDRTN